MTLEHAVNCFACLCSFHGESKETSMNCRDCGKPMYIWKTRVPKVASITLSGEAADKRNDMGGY